MPPPRRERHAGRGRVPAALPALAALLLLLAPGAGAQGADVPLEPHVAVVERDPDVPPLPFADNPDPSLCGIPQPVGSDDAGRATGRYDGVLVQDPVLLYDSHLRRRVVGGVPDGHPLTLLLFQANPELDYFLVRATVDGATVEGWLPAPFVVRDTAGGG